jgi:hypothetical protein
MPSKTLKARGDSMSTVKHVAEFRIGQPIETVFPLFSAEGEKRWVPGWDYENILGSNTLHEDYVFLTRNHDHASTDAIWLVKRYAPETHFVQFYKIEPEDKIGIIAVQCIPITDCQTQVEVSYEYIGLSKKGDKFIEEFGPTEYKTFIAEWNRLLVSYFESKR